ncbi:MAG TPA: hypothetical protein PK789_05915 [Thermomonas sp.]|jgi:hypothetical protein|uniref:hypothetical protein n=1 Tax=Thermomonas sp. TaxID=1971895 RepID=UPI002C425A36|nr:hypothetical protein [Thermomonas sp.]HOV96290.1 hypothetical protein [Thermomonas sp.]
MKKIFFPLVMVMVLLPGCKQESDSTAAPIKQESVVKAAAVDGASAGNAKKEHTLSATYANDPRFKATSWDALLAALAPDERAYLDRLNAEYYGTLEYKDANELAMMKQLGMPLPEDFLAAAKLSDDELKKLADAGDPMAKLLYPNRLLDNAIRDINGLNQAQQKSGEDLRADIALPVYMEVTKAMRSSKNPFAAYTDGRMNYAMSTEHAPEDMAGAIFAAAARGDRRAVRIFNDFSEAHPSTNNKLMMQVFSGYLVTSDKH